MGPAPGPLRSPRWLLLPSARRRVFHPNRQMLPPPPVRRARRAPQPLRCPAGGEQPGSGASSRSGSSRSGSTTTTSCGTRASRCRRCSWPRCSPRPASPRRWPPSSRAQSGAAGEGSRFRSDSELNSVVGQGLPFSPRGLGLQRHPTHPPKPALGESAQQPAWSWGHPTRAGSSRGPGVGGPSSSVLPPPPCCGCGNGAGGLTPGGGRCLPGRGQQARYSVRFCGERSQSPFANPKSTPTWGQRGRDSGGHGCRKALELGGRKLMVKERLVGGGKGEGWGGGLPGGGAPGVLLLRVCGVRGGPGGGLSRTLGSFPGCRSPCGRR